MRPPDGNRHGDPAESAGSGPDAATAELLQAAYRYAVGLAADPDDAEDLVQEGWLRVRVRYGAEADRRLLFRAIRNLHFDGWRRASRFPSEALDEFDARHSDGGAGDPSRACGGGALGAQLARLRDVEREALLLSVVEGYSATEIAALTGAPRGTVLSLVHRAKAKLEGWLDEADAEARARGGTGGGLRLVPGRDAGTQRKEGT